MNKQEIKNLIPALCTIALNAGKAILEVYQTDFSVEQKNDKSPLTEADQKSHLEIVKGLKQFEFPILSEEGRSIPYEERKNWEYFWMVDPLDGTKEFIKRNGEFTVNIALIHQQKAILGVIYVPVKDEMYFGAQGVGSYKIDEFSTKAEPEPGDLMADQYKLPKSVDRVFTVVGSRSHMSEDTEKFINQQKAEHGEVEILSVGSSLKLCMVAEGKADMYPRFAPTMEWDTAAGQAIVESAGGKVLDWKSGDSKLYNRENLLNDWFLVTT